MKPLKKLLPGLLCALAICVCLPFRAEAATYTGSCGTNATWSLNTSTGVLSITGTGAMDDYTAAKQMPWYSYTKQVKSIVVGEGITRVGSMNFIYNMTAQTISLPSTLKSIGDSAFYSCKATSVTIPAGVTSIGVDAFDSMPNLTHITVEAGNPYYSSDNGVLY